MHEIIELTLAGQMISTPLGATISLPYLPWGPDQILNLTEEDRAEVLEVVRRIREDLLRSIKT